MLIIHHLGVSQSDRIVWLAEELGLPYQLKWYHRQENGLMPADYLALHPASTAPVITDGDLVMAESTAIVEYLCHRHGGGRFTVRPDQPDYPHYLYWLQFNNNIMGLFLGRMGLNAGPGTGPEAERVAGLIARREAGYYGYLEKRLGEAPYLGGAEFTCADIMSMFTLTSLPLFGGRGIEDLPNTQAYVQRVTGRPAYVKAMQLAGPAATPPA
ncbi:MAG: glutathione S-transferase family protein [Gammaproteobacteria bacterium]